MMDPIRSRSTAPIPPPPAPIYGAPTAMDAPAADVIPAPPAPIYGAPTAMLGEAPAEVEPGEVAGLPTRQDDRALVARALRFFDDYANDQGQITPDRIGPQRESDPAAAALLDNFRELTHGYRDAGITRETLEAVAGRLRRDPKTGEAGATTIAEAVAQLAQPANPEAAAALTDPLGAVAERLQARMPAGTTVAVVGDQLAIQQRGNTYVSFARGEAGWSVASRARGIMLDYPEIRAGLEAFGLPR